MNLRVLSFTIAEEDALQQKREEEQIAEDVRTFHKAFYLKFGTVDGLFSSDDRIKATRRLSFTDTPWVVYTCSIGDDLSLYYSTCGTAIPVWYIESSLQGKKLLLDRKDLFMYLKKYLASKKN